MRITVDRFISDSDTTISRVHVDGEFVCFGLEDEFREDKVSGETRIGAGTYPVRIRTEGGFHDRYRTRFPDFHQGMLHIQDVPKFEFILIHCGNTDEDTEGCLLVGSQALTEPGDMRVTQSVAAYQRLYQRVLSAALGGNLSISFEDNDRAQHAAVSEAVTAVGDSRNRGDTVEISKSDKWEVTNLAHRFTTSFFKSQYGDRPESVSGRPDFSNRELLYFNEASADQTTSATICAGLLVTYMEAQGIPYHRDKTRKLCFDMLQPHLANGEGTVLHTADIIDHHFRFMNEVSIDG